LYSNVLKVVDVGRHYIMEV